MTITIVRLKRRGAGGRGGAATDWSSYSRSIIQKNDRHHVVSAAPIRRRSEKVTITKPDYWDKLHAKCHGIALGEAIEARQQKAAESASKAQNFLNDGHRIERSNTRLNLRTLVPHMRAADPILRDGDATPWVLK